HVAHTPVEVDGNDRPRPGGDSGLQLRHVHVVVVTYLHEHRPRADVHDRRDGSEERMAGRDDLVTGPDARGQKGEVERVVSAVDTDGVLDADERGQVRLEVPELLAVDQVPLAEALRDGGID